MFFGIDCSACCEKCFRFNWAREVDQPWEFRGCSPGQLGGTITLELPASAEIPSGGFTVTYRVNADDKITINDDWLGPLNENACYANQGQSGAAGTLKVNGRTLTFKFYDTVGGNVGGGACICVQEVPSPLFEKRSLQQGGGTLDIDGWKLTYPPITKSSPFVEIQWYLDQSFVENCQPLSLNPLP